MIKVLDEWVPLVQLVGISDHDLEVLHTHKDFFERHAEEIVQSFYEEIMRISNLKEIIEEHSTKQRLQAGWGGYWRSLGDADIDEAYIEGRQHVGSVHVRIGLSEQWVMAGEMLFIRLFNQYRNEVSDADFAPAFLKRLHLDIMIMCKSYRENALLENALSLSTLVTQMTGTTEQVATSSQSISERIQEIVDAFEHMRTEIDNARELISFMNDIASHSHILGLNASIEASRAGEEGRGFTVIAKEIRKMAEQSRDYATQITDRLNDLFGTTNNVNQMIEDISNLSEAHLAGSEKLSASFVKIEQTAKKIQNV